MPEEKAATCAFMYTIKNSAFPPSVSRNAMNPGVLFVMRSWKGPSEYWMERMLRCLSGDLAAIVARAPADVTWGNGVPVIRLGQSRQIQRVLFRAGIGKGQRFYDTREIMRALNRPSVRIALVNYADWAIRFNEAWDASDKPLFVHFHGVDLPTPPLGDEQSGTEVEGEAYRANIRLLSERATLIVNSVASRKILQTCGIAENRIKLKYYGVDIPDPVFRTASRSCEFLYLGRLIDFKGPIHCIRAFELACRRGLNGRLTIAGDGPLRLECEKAIAASPYMARIQLLGAVSWEVGDRLRQESDVFVAHNRKGEESNREEALGVSVLEAMAAGLPVVTGRSGGVLETVIDGETGLLFPPGDIAAQADALLQLAEPNIRKQFSKAARAHVQDNFSAEAERRQLREILGISGT